VKDTRLGAHEKPQTLPQRIPAQDGFPCCDPAILNEAELRECCRFVKPTRHCKRKTV